MDYYDSFFYYFNFDTEISPEIHVQGSGLEIIDLYDRYIWSLLYDPTNFR